MDCIRMVAIINNTYTFEAIYSQSENLNWMECEWKARISKKKEQQSTDIYASMQSNSVQCGVKANLDLGSFSTSWWTRLQSHCINNAHRHAEYFMAFNGNLTPFQRHNMQKTGKNPVFCICVFDACAALYFKSLLTLLKKKIAAMLLLKLKKTPIPVFIASLLLGKCFEGITIPFFKMKKKKIIIWRCSWILLRNTSSKFIVQDFFFFRKKYVTSDELMALSIFFSLHIFLWWPF